MAELRFIEDFPVKGVRFIDISPKLADKNDFAKIIEEMCMVVANKLNIGFVPIRKPGKLPEDLVLTVDYYKEYGKDSLCLPTNENYKGKNFYFIDDVLATGGTLEASKKLIEKCGGNFVGAGVYINIKALNNLDVNHVENV